MRLTGRLFQALLLLVLIAAGIAWLSGGLGPRIMPGVAKIQSAEIPPGTEEHTLEPVTETAVEWASGALASASRTVVSSRILARIKEVRVTAGDRVNAGDVLIVLESRDLDARVEQARDALRAAEAELELARAEEARAKELLERGVGTRKNYDQARSALGVARAQVDRAKRALDEAEASLSYARIEAPVGGRVVDRLAEPGDIASPGAPLLRIYDPARLRVEAPVRESLAVRLEVGQEVPVEVSAVDDRFDGVIDEIVPFAEPGARTLLVKVALPADPNLFAGMFARIGVPAGERTRLYVPQAAIERIGQLEFVSVRTGEDRTERRMITTGPDRRNGDVEVLSGLKAGETVLIPPSGRQG